MALRHPRTIWSFRINWGKSSESIRACPAGPVWLPETISSMIEIQTNDMRWYEYGSNFEFLISPWSRSSDRIPENSHHLWIIPQGKMWAWLDPWPLLGMSDGWGMWGMNGNDVYHLLICYSSPWKITMLLIGKPSINGPFPMAMLNNQRVDCIVWSTKS